MTVDRFELLPVVIPGIAGGQQQKQFRLPHNPNLYGARLQKITLVSATTALTGEPIFPAAADCFLVLQIRGKERVKLLPLADLSEATDGVPAYGTRKVGAPEFNLQQVAWDSSYLSFTVSPGNTVDKVVLLGIHYTFTPAQYAPFKVNQYELLQVRVVNGAKRIYLPDNANLRGVQVQRVVAYTSAVTQVPPYGNQQTFSAAVNQFITLHAGNTNIVSNMPLLDLVQTGENGRYAGPNDFADHKIAWDKSYIEFSVPPVLATNDWLMLLGVYYKLPASKR